MVGTRYMSSDKTLCWLPCPQAQAPQALGKPACAARPSPVRYWKLSPAAAGAQGKLGWPRRDALALGRHGQVRAAASAAAPATPTAISLARESAGQAS